MIALLAPGQGSKTPGMLAPWLDDPGAADSVARWSAAAGLDLRRLGVDAAADEIVDTAVTQPLVVAAALLAAARLTAKSELPTGVIGIAIGSGLLPEMSRRLTENDAAGATAGQLRRTISIPAFRHGATSAAWTK